MDKQEIKQNKEELEEVSQEINKLKSGYSNELYNQCLADWDYKKHDIFNEEKHPDERVLVELGESEKENKYKTRYVNRIPFALEQDIVNIHTSFTIGLPPELNAKPQNEAQEQLISLIQATEKATKLSALNKQIVRSWLSECMVAEYWYNIEDEDFYEIQGVDSIGKRLKAVVWSPFRGDTLIPEFDKFGDLMRFNRFYRTKNDMGKEVERVMRIDNRRVITYELSDGAWTLLSDVLHGFDKLPIIYMKRKEPLTAPIRAIRSRLEFLASNYADCVDYNFAPKLLLQGDIENVEATGKTQMIMLQNGADVKYLTWQQSPEHVKLEMDNLIDRAYSLTNTPIISVKDMQGAGNAFSGESFKYMYMGTHLAVRNHEEVVGEYLTRRYNFLIHAICLHVPSLKTARLLEINPSLKPYVLDSERDKIDTSVSMFTAGLISQEAALRYSGVFDPEKDKAKEQAQSLY